ncbi:MAG: LysR family transcriptional regulator [Eubacteriales bacterium]
MDKNIIKYLAFVKTVEYGSFTKAAEILHYTQSGISRMISELEGECNLTLLERSRSGVRLTGEGTLLLPYAKSLCSEYEKLWNQVNELNGLRSGIIRIGTISSIATHWLPNIIKHFQSDYPGIDYELLQGDYGEIEEWIAEGRVDCGFLILPTRSEFDTIFLADDKLKVILPENHPFASYERFPKDEIEKEPFMLLEKGEKGEISQLLIAYDLHPRVHFTTWDDYSLMSMVESGLGISILPELILKRVPYRIVIKDLDVPAYRKIALAMKDRRTASLTVKRFLDYLDYRVTE